MVATLYLLFTFAEWFMHRYMMHNRIDLPYLRSFHESHILHHSITGPDMTSQCHDRMHDDLCFQPISIIIIFIISCLVIIPLFSQWFPVYVLVGHIALFTLVEIVLWNTLHSYIHHVRYDFSPCFLRNHEIPIPIHNPYIRWVISNHRAHHFFKGTDKGNFNVVFPGADFIMGTHNQIP